MAMLKGCQQQVLQPAGGLWLEPSMHKRSTAAAPLLKPSFSIWLEEVSSSTWGPQQTEEHILLSAVPLIMNNL